MFLCGGKEYNGYLGECMAKNVFLEVSHVLCITKLRDLANLCIHHPCHRSKCIALSFDDNAITLPFICIWNVFVGVGDLHMGMVF